MQQNIPPTTVHTALVSEHSSFADLFPQTRSLERMLLEHTFVKATAVLCENYRRDRWQCRKVSDTVAYVVPTRSDAYVVNVKTTGFNGKVSADMFGLMVTLTVFGYLAALMKQGEYAEPFCNLREYALQHPQAQCIRAALGLKGGGDAK